jgi:hypothetical protein
MNTSYQREAVARLTTLCEKIAASGVLPVDQELALRALTNIACTAFDMATVVDRATETEGMVG